MTKQLKKLAIIALAPFIMATAFADSYQYVKTRVESGTKVSIYRQEKVEAKAIKPSKVKAKYNAKDISERMNEIHTYVMSRYQKEENGCKLPKEYENFISSGTKHYKLVELDVIYKEVYRKNKLLEYIIKDAQMYPLIQMKGDK